MKTATPDTMKFRRLQRRLGTSKAVTVGILELLWIATAKSAPQGDIGKFSNEEIAIECDYEGDPETLIGALVDCRWLDVHDDCRLVVHDWAEHAPTHVANNLKRWGKWFIVPKDSPKDIPLDSPKDAPIGSSFQAKPSQAIPGQAKPSQQLASGRAAAVDWLAIENPEEVAEVVSNANKLLKACRSLDKEFIFQTAWIGFCIDRGWLGDKIAAISGKDKPAAWLKSALRRECEDRGFTLAEALACVPAPPPVKEVVK